MYYLINNITNEVMWTSTYPQNAQSCSCTTEEHASIEQKEIIAKYKEKLEKLDLKSDYKSIQINIAETKAELQEINETYDTYSEQWKIVADAQIVKLNNDLTELRTKKDLLVTGAIEKYGMEVINEL